MAAPLLRAGPVPFIGQEPAHGRQQERAEPALLPVGARDPVLGQQPGEELLRQVLRVRRRMAPPPHVGIEGIPVSAAQLLQRAVRLRRGCGRPAASTTVQCVVAKTAPGADVAGSVRSVFKGKSLGWDRARSMRALAPLVNDKFLMLACKRLGLWSVRRSPRPNLPGGRRVPIEHQSRTNRATTEEKSRLSAGMVAALPRGALGPPGYSRPNLRRSRPHAPRHCRHLWRRSCRLDGGPLSLDTSSTMSNLIREAIAASASWMSTNTTSRNSPQPRSQPAAVVPAELRRLDPGAALPLPSETRDGRPHAGRRPAHLLGSARTLSAAQRLQLIRAQPGARGHRNSTRPARRRSPGRTGQALDEAVRQKHRQPDWCAEVLRRAGVERIITDPYSDPLLDARQALGPNYRSVLPH